MLSFNDEISDLEPNVGFLDDEFAKAHVLREVEKDGLKVPESIKGWRLSCQEAKADRLLGIKTRKKLNKE